MTAQSGILGNLSKDLIKRVGVGAASGAALGAVATGKDGDLSGNVLRGALVGGAAGGGFHALKNHSGTIGELKSMVGLAKEPGANALGKKPNEMVNRINDSIGRIASGDKRRGAQEVRAAIGDMRGNLSHDTSDSAKQMLGHLSDLEDLAHMSETNAFGRFFKQLNVFKREHRQIPVFDSSIANKMNETAARLAELHNR